jgi:hypothetical protein
MGLHIILIEMAGLVIESASKNMIEKEGSIFPKTQTVLCV